jgi:DNA-binding transcriptional LysR family regulator
VERHRLHCGFLRVPVARPDGITFEPLFGEAALLAVPLDHRLARAPKAESTAIRLTDLDGERLILVRRPGAPGLYANLLAACERAGVRPLIAAEVERMMMNLNLVAAGAGISVVPASMRGVHAQSVVYRPLPRKPELGVPMTLVYRTADVAGPTATLLALARQVAKHYDEHTGVRHA